MGTGPSDWRHSKLLAVIELAVFAGLFVADAMGVIPFSKTLFLLVLVVASFLIRRVRWRQDVGFRPYRTWVLTIVLGILGGAAIEGIELYVSQPFLVHVLHERPDLSDFEVLHGNATILALALALVWTLAAFGEEIVYRGYLLNRVAGLFGGGRVGDVIGLAVMTVAFGFAHSYQGATGIIDEAFMGLLLGLMYLGAGRSLLVPIIAHGVQDTIDALLLYFGAYPMPTLN